MAASYPGTKRAFVTRVDTTDVVYASHMNDVQDEVAAIQDTVGTNPHVSTTGAGSTLGAWSGAARTYASLADRLANIEAGLIADTHSQYARLANTETFTGVKTFSASTTFFGASSGTSSGIVYLSSGTTGGEATLTWRDGTTPRWAMYRISAGTDLFLRDMVNARQQVTFTPGASVTAATTTLHSSLTAQGNATISGTLGVTGATTMAAVTLSGALTLAAGTGLAPSISAVGDAAAGGTSTTVARADHVHGREAFGASTAAADAAAGAAGAALTPSRSDHKHTVTVGNVVAATTFGLAAANGTSTALARADHNHGTPAAQTLASLNAVNRAGDTMTGGLTITGTGAPGGNAASSLRLAGAHPTMEWHDTDVAGANYRAWWHLNSGQFYLLTDVNNDGGWDSPYPMVVRTDKTVNFEVGLYEAGARVYSANNPPPSAAPVVIMPFFVGGSIGVGLRRPEFIATVPMRIRGSRSRSHAGSGSYQVYLNGASVSGAAAAFGTAQALHDFADVDINPGDRVQINIASATADAVDLSVTVDTVTR